ncbi:MAG: hypothetical protein WC348_00845 [Patescibacteria group bacterium]|jgi:hypothetical protein
MKKFIFPTVAVLAVLILTGAGCAWFPAEEEATNAPLTTETNVNAPSDPTAGWEVYESVPWAIEMKYPAKYKTIFDTYGWPHSLVHFIEAVPGTQSYRAQIETWDSEGEFRATYSRDPAFIVEHPNGKNWVTVDYNSDPSDPAVAEEWELIISTFRFTAP